MYIYLFVRSLCSKHGSRSNMLHNNNLTQWGWCSGIIILRQPSTGWITFKFRRVSNLGLIFEFACSALLCIPLRFGSRDFSGGRRPSADREWDVVGSVIVNYMSLIGTKDLNSLRLHRAPWGQDRTLIGILKFHTGVHVLKKFFCRIFFWITRTTLLEYTQASSGSVNSNFFTPWLLDSGWSFDRWLEIYITWK